MKEQQIFLGTRVFPMVWILWNSPACTPNFSKDYEIKKNRSRDLYKTLINLNKSALMHLARLIDNPAFFADNLMTSIFRLKFNSLAPFEKTGFVTSWSKECHVMLGVVVEPFTWIPLRY